MIIPFWVKALVIVGIVFGIYIAGVSFLNSVREEGRNEVRKQWEAARIAAEKQATEAGRKAEIRLAADEAQREKVFAQLRNKNDDLRAQLSRACVDPLLVNRMRDSVRASNDQGAREPEKGAPIATGTPNGDQLDDWFNEVARLYRACREQVINWIKWDDERVAQ